MQEGKTEVLAWSPDKFMPKIIKALGPHSTFAKSSIRKLRVTLDSALMLDVYVKSLVRFCFYHLRNIAKLSPIVSHIELQIGIHAFISSHLDYCNSLFIFLRKNSLQVVQNAAVMDSEITFHFKILVLTFRALHGQAPAYIIEILHSVSLAGP